jgi:hypothetical protein
VIGSGPYPPGEVAEVLATPLLGVLPDDPAAARQLAGGGGRALARSRLWRALIALADDLTGQQAAVEAPAGTPTVEPVDAAAADLTAGVG